MINSMPIESGPQNRSPREIFFTRIKNQVEGFQKIGELPDVYVSDLLERVSLIEGPFDDDADALKKAEDFMAAVLPIVEFTRLLNKQEIRFLATAGKVTHAREILERNDTLDTATRETLTKGLNEIEDKINKMLEGISKARSQIV